MWAGASLGVACGRPGWPQLLELLTRAAELEHPLGRDPEAWLALADDASSDDDAESDALNRLTNLDKY